MNRMSSGGLIICDLGFRVEPMEWQGTVLYAVATFRYRSDIAAEFSSSRATADQQLAINQSHLFVWGVSLGGGLR
jgi:hypothetical protein